MENNIAVKVTNLTKIYNLYDKPQDRLKEALHPFRKSYHHDFFALDDISFEIKKAQTLGIIGKNGAGKSTLLKIITGILNPTKGNVQVNGKIASLLELGAGFNPDMTGIENIYLNGTIMGFSKKDMDLKLNDILEFANIGEFAYQLVKTYSSGMFARLAFAVAINVQADILIVDEALSVGDVRFQSKCFRKMEDIASSGTTVIFVSHDIQAIQKFCKEVIWIDNGKMIKKGKPTKILEDYMSFMTYGLTSKKIENVLKIDTKEIDTIEDFPLIDVSSCDSFGKKDAIITGVLFLNDENKATKFIKQGTYATIICEFISKIDLEDVSIGVLFKSKLNNEVLTFNSYMYDCPLRFVKKSEKIKTTIRFKVPKLHPEEYIITFALSEGTQLNHIQQHWIHEATSINIISSDFIDACLVSLYKKEIKYTYESV